MQLVPEGLPTFRADVAVLFGKYLPRNGIYCDIVGTATSGDMVEQGFSSARRPAYSSQRWRRELAFLFLCLRALIGVKKSSCDIIQVRDMVSIGLLGLMIAKVKRIPFVYWMSFLMCQGRIQRARAEIAAGGGVRYRFVLLKGLVERAILNRCVLAFADHIFVQSDAMRDFLVAQGISSDKLTPVPMGVDTEALDCALVARRPKGWEDFPLVGYLGTLDQLRRLTEVVDALVMVRKVHPSACLLLVGDSPTPSDVPKLLSYAAELGLGEAVRVTGWLPSAQAWGLMASVDVAISYIPRGELFDVSSPTKLLEYLALGVPCIGNDNPDQKQVLSGAQAGWLTESHAQAFAEAMIEILAAPQLARSRAAAGPGYIEANRSYRVLSEMVAAQYAKLSSR